MNKILRSFLENEAAIKRYLSRFLKLSQDIDDAAQETFLKAYAADIKTTVRSPKAFLFKVAKHTALHQVERKSFSTTDRIEDFANPEVLYENPSPGCEEIFDSQRKLILFTHAVAKLPPKCQQVFILRKVEGLSMKEIATKMDISVSAVEKHVATGLIKCCDFFRAKGYDPAELGPIAAQYAQLVPDKKLRVTRSEDG